MVQDANHIGGVLGLTELYRSRIVSLPSELAAI
jgi:hypothetical protein